MIKQAGLLDRWIAIKQTAERYGRYRSTIKDFFPHSEFKEGELDEVY